MTRTTIFIAALTAAVALPSAAAAHCSSQQGSFTVTCEQGVTVFRHRALSSIPQGLSAADARIEIEKLRQETAQAKIDVDARAHARNAKLRERELAIADYSARANARYSGRRYYTPYGGGYGNYNLAGYRSGPVNNAERRDNGGRNTRATNTQSTSVETTATVQTRRINSLGTIRNVPKSHGSKPARNSASRSSNKH